MKAFNTYLTLNDWKVKLNENLKFNETLLQFQMPDDSSHINFYENAILQILNLKTLTTSAA